MSVQEANKQICRDYFKAFLARDTAWMAKHIAPDFVRHDPGLPFEVRGPQGVAQLHDALLPAFPGLHTHERAIEAGCKFAGATVHRVTAELDHGPILAQAVVPVLPDDTADTLAARVLTQEHLIYPKAVAELLAH